ncbi:hypothetical protein ABMA32_17065 [Mesorhizobium sp. VNQ89]|uniref:hypothetical protein n=1 Tax=Mesorhizobium quangtriensis TaxID=3157709 RepID=UPI0032B880E1
MAIVIFVAAPVATIAFHFGVAALSVLFHMGATPRQQELMEVSKKYRNVHGPNYSDQALLLIDRFGELLPTRLASVQLLLDEEKFDGGSLTDKLRAARIAAPKYASAECRALLEAFASHCRLSEASVSTLQGMIEIRFTLQFVQQGNFGEFPDRGDMQLDVAHLEYGAFNDRPLSFLAEGTTSARRRTIYAAIAKDCVATRSIYGNCAIQGIRIGMSASGTARNIRVSTSGTATLASIGEISDKRTSEF